MNDPALSSSIMIAVGLGAVAIKLIMGMLDHYRVLEKVPPPLRVVITGSLAALLALFNALVIGDPPPVAALIALAAFGGSQGMHAFAKGVRDRARK